MRWLQPQASCWVPVDVFCWGDLTGALPAPSPCHHGLMGSPVPSPAADTMGRQGTAREPSMHACMQHPVAARFGMAVPCATSPRVPSSEASALHPGPCRGWHGDGPEPFLTALGADISPCPQLHCFAEQSSWDGAALCIIAVSGEQILLCSGWKSLRGEMSVGESAPGSLQGCSQGSNPHRPAPAPG